MTNATEASPTLDVTAEYERVRAADLPVHERVRRLSMLIRGEYERIVGSELPLENRVEHLSTLTRDIETARKQAVAERAFAVLTLLRVWMFTGREFERIDQDLRAKADAGAISVAEFEDLLAQAGRRRDDERRGHPKPADVWLRLLKSPRNLMTNISDRAPRPEDWPEVPNAEDVALTCHTVALELHELKAEFCPVRDELIRDMLNDWPNADVARLTGLKTSHIAIIRGGRR